MRRALVLLAPLAVALLAGCIATDPADPASEAGAGPDPGETVPDDWPSTALPVGADHDHEDPADHRNRTTPNVEVLGWDPLVTDATGTTSGGHLCGDAATEGDRDLAVVHSYTTDVAFVLVDVSDPEDPEKVGELVLPRTSTRDIELASDGTHVAIATSGPSTSDDLGVPAAEGGTRTVQPVWRDACGETYQGPEQEIPYANGVLLVDIRDVTDPVVADYAPAPLIGAHSIHATTVDGTDWVLSSVTNLAHGASYFTFFHVVETMDGLELRERYVHGAKTPSADQAPTEQPLVNGHVDGWIETHPVTGDPLAYLANWDAGLVVLDLSDGPPYEVLGRWTDYDPSTDDGDLPYTRSAMTGNLHTADPIDTTWDGRHYTFVGQEVPSRPPRRPTGQVVMLDTTDPGAPEPVARWTLPVDVRWNGFLQFSTHYTAVDEETRTLMVSLYHGGVWAVDADPDAGPELPTLGAFVPARESPAPPENPDAAFTWSPTVLEVARVGDAFFVSDATSGAYMVGFDRDAPAEVPQPEPWTKDSWIEDTG